MLDLSIAGFGMLCLSDLVCDYNGTLARDGELLEGVRARLERTAELLRIHVITADTFGTAREQLHGLPCRLEILSADRQHEAKAKYVNRLDSKRVVAFGNGRNDRLMLARAALAIGISGDEGIAFAALQRSDIVVRHPADAFDLLLDPRRLTATLRS